MEVNAVNVNPFGLKRRRSLFPSWLIGLCFVGLASFFGWLFLGPGGDLRLLQLRVLMDGAAPEHRFFQGSDLEGVVFAELNMKGSEFPQLNLSRAEFQGASLRGAVFTRCTIGRANFRNADLVGASLTGCSLEGADLRGADLSRADLAESDLSFALLSGASMRGTNLDGTDLTGAVGLSIAGLGRCKNWHLARYDGDTIAAIRAELPLKAIQALGFPSWEEWQSEQRKLAASPEALPPSARSAQLP